MAIQHYMKPLGKVLVKLCRFCANGRPTLTSKIEADSLLYIYVAKTGIMKRVAFYCLQDASQTSKIM